MSLTRWVRCDFSQPLSNCVHLRFHCAFWVQRRERTGAGLVPARHWQLTKSGDEAVPAPIFKVALPLRLLGRRFLVSLVSGLLGFLGVAAQAGLLQLFLVFLA